MRDARGVTTSHGRGERCSHVIMVPRGGVTPAELLQGLAERGAEVRVVYDVPNVMVELANGAQAVIVTDTRSFKRLPELLAAVKRYYPNAACWQFAIAADGQPSLEKIGGGHHVAPPPPPVSNLAKTPPQPSRVAANHNPPSAKSVLPPATNSKPAPPVQHEVKRTIATPSSVLPPTGAVPEAEGPANIFADPPTGTSAVPAPGFPGAGLPLPGGGKKAQSLLTQEEIAMLLAPLPELKALLEEEGF